MDRKRHGRTPFADAGSAEINLLSAPGETADLPMHLPHEGSAGFCCLFIIPYFHQESFNMTSFRNFKVVSKFVYGRGAFSQLDEILQGIREKTSDPIVFLLDDIFQHTPLQSRVPAHQNDLLILTSAETEPKTRYVDGIRDRIMDQYGKPPKGVVGIGGGSIMDIAKAVSLVLTNPGSSADYQGWDLVRQPGVYHAGIPTLSGTGAEVSRTTVLTGPEKKLGINSDHTVFDQVVLDPDLIAGAPANQRFYTGMDCYIHCVESLEGTYINEFSRSYAEKAMSLCIQAFEEQGPKSDEKLMMASYFGGMSIAYSQVGVCHALSYGLSFALGVRHGIGNCVVFNHLDEFYPQGVKGFREMLQKNHISLPNTLQFDGDEKKLEKMVDVALVLAPLWENAVGPGWQKVITRQRIRNLYETMLSDG